MEDGKVRMSVEVDKETHAKLMELAKADQRSLNVYCSRVLTAHVAKADVAGKK